MVKQPVLIKGSHQGQGIIVILDESISFEMLRNEVVKKFEESKGFFARSKMIVTFEGRELSLKEEGELLDIIKKVCKIEIINRVEKKEEKDTEEKVRNQQEDRSIMGLQDGKFYKGTLRSGQVLESETSIVVLGDVNPGAKVISKGNVIILGTLKGNVFAGATGNKEAIVVALDMNPMQIRIGDTIACSADEKPAFGMGRKKKKVEVTPQIAYVENGNIYIEPITKDVLNDINI